MSGVTDRQDENMVYTASAMYRIAEAIAKEKGPVGVKMDDGVHVAYALKRFELRKIFMEHGYSMRRSTWVSNIKDWADVYGAWVPSDIETKMRPEWSVIFTELNSKDETDLDYASSTMNYPRFPPKKVAQ